MHTLLLFWAILIRFVCFFIFEGFGKIDHGYAVGRHGHFHPFDLNKLAAGFDARLQIVLMIATHSIRSDLAQFNTVINSSLTVGSQLSLKPQ